MLVCMIYLNYISYAIHLQRRVINLSLEQCFIWVFAALLSLSWLQTRPGPRACKTLCGVFKFSHKSPCCAVPARERNKRREWEQWQRREGRKLWYKAKIWPMPRWQAWKRWEGGRRWEEKHHPNLISSEWWTEPVYGQSPRLLLYLSLFLHIVRDARAYCLCSQKAIFFHFISVLYQEYLHAGFRLAQTTYCNRPQCESL